MSFKRARSREHKEERREQIMDAALNLLETTEYEKITLAAIANDLCFTRANLYKYVSSKDEIFLWIILRDVEEWMDDVSAGFAGKAHLCNGEIAALWSEVFCRHTRVLMLMSILSTIIEQNVSVEKLAEFKKGLFEVMIPFVESLETFIPRLDRERRQDFITSQLYYAQGLYSSIRETEVQKKAMELAGIDYCQPDFRGEMTRFLKILLDGLEEEQREGAL